MNQTEGGQKLRIGIVGSGYQGGRLAEAIGLTPSMVVTACADTNPAAAAELAQRAGDATAHESVDDLLAHAAVDAVMVATPHHVLAELSLKAIEAGKHVLCEKPIGMNEQEAIRVEQAVARAGVCYMAGYSFRYLAAWQLVHKLLAEGAVGEIVAISGAFGLGPMSDGWAADPTTGGGPLFYVGSHLIDQILWYVADEPTEVYADIRYRSDTKADETSAFTIRFARGVTAQCMVTQAADRFFNDVDIYGRAGHINLRWIGLMDYEIRVTSNALDEYKQPAVIHPEVTGDPRNAKHRLQLKDFNRAIAEHRQPPVTVRDGRRVLQVMDAVFASARIAAPVVFPA